MNEENDNGDWLGKQPTLWQDYSESVCPLERGEYITDGTLGCFFLISYLNFNPMDLQ